MGKIVEEDSEPEKQLMFGMIFKKMIPSKSYIYNKNEIFDGGFYQKNKTKSQKKI